MARPASAAVAGAHAAPGPAKMLLAAAAALFALDTAAPETFAAIAPSAALVAIVLVGLPHGTLDIKVIQDAHRLGARETIAVLGLYVGLALLTGLVWWVSPLLALAMFLAIGAWHFAEDWTLDGPAPLSLFVPLAMFSAGATSHAADYDAIFSALVRSGDGAFLTLALQTIAPVAHGGAAVAAWVLWRSGDGWRAAAALVSVAGMWAFGPLVGFGLFFAAYHSPIHLGEALGAVRGRPLRLAAEGGATFAASVAGIWLLAALIGDAPGLSGPGAGVFIALSMLTVPHMLVPVVVSEARRRRIALACRLRPGPGAPAPPGPRCR